MSAGLGQFFTPPEVARFMAHLAATHLQKGQHKISVLDPGCGTGVLTRELLAHPAQIRASCTLCDVDPVVLAEAAKIPNTTTTTTNESVTVVVECRDFVIDPPPGPFDLIISNPPYLKIGAGSPQAQAAQARGLEGRTNLYSLFLAQAARLLHPDGGVLVFLVPRSFASGKYFEGFRRQFFGQVHLEHVHLFHSRSDAFKGDSVLQENLILCCTRRPQPLPLGVVMVMLSFSHGVQDLDRRREHQVDRQVVLGSGVLRLPQSEEEIEVLREVDALPATLATLGCQVSTGPIVAHRLRDQLRYHAAGGEATFPLLWIHHVRPMEVVWPLEGVRKPQWILQNPLLLPLDQDCVLVRRFSAKEQSQRIIAAPLVMPDEVKWIGVENHINIIYCPTQRLAQGLAKFLNSPLVDHYFRIFNGNTQISATELRLLPCPDAATLEQM